MQIEPRSDWGAQPPESTTSWNVAELDGICQHWFGSPKAAKLHGGCDDLLRSVQRTHQAGEYSDIAYSFGACPHGVVYELRGWNVQTGANGTTDANRRFLAVVYMAGVGDPLTVKGRVALEALYAEAFRKGVAVAAIRHGSITGSACPGPDVSKWLASGTWKPKPPAQPKHLFRLASGEGAVLGNSIPVGGDRAKQKERLVKFVTAHADLILDEHDREEKAGEPQDVRLQRVKA